MSNVNVECESVLGFQRAIQIPGFLSTLLVYGRAWCLSLRPWVESGRLQPAFLETKTNTINKRRDH